MAYAYNSNFNLCNIYLHHVTLAIFFAFPESGWAGNAFLPDYYEK